MALTYRKRPIEIEAVRYVEGNLKQCLEFIGKSGFALTSSDQLYIITLEGGAYASKGDYLIKGVKGEFYPCKPDVFRANYDLVQNL